MNKEELRKKYLGLRDALSPDQIEESSLKIANKALELPIWDRTYYHIFLPITNKKEVNTEFLLHILQGKDKSIVVPKADFESGALTIFFFRKIRLLRIQNMVFQSRFRELKFQPIKWT